MVETETEFILEICFKGKLSNLPFRAFTNFTFSVQPQLKGALPTPKKLPKNDSHGYQMNSWAKIQIRNNTNAFCTL